ncbi:MAG: sensor histidine kinase [Kiritimatiellia bacterium]
MSPSIIPTETCGPTSRNLILRALTIPAIYVIFASIYIYFSGHIAKMLSQDAQQLAMIESTKGFVYVLVTGGLLFVLCLLWVRRLQQQTMLLVQSERRAIAGMASAGLAHDLNNILMVIDTLLEELKEQEQQNESLHTILQQLQTGMDEVSRFAKSLARTARNVEPDAEREIELSSRIPFIAKLVYKHPDVHRCKLQVHAIPPATMRLNVALLEQALLNLIINAAQAAGPGGRIEVSMQHQEAAIRLKVEDSGPGLDPKDRHDVFSPGYTTKKNGSGLGLLCVRAFAESCNASIFLETSPLGGAAFAIEIPLQDTDLAETATSTENALGATAEAAQT